MTLSVARPSLELVTRERRRRWTGAEKERLVAASFAPGVSASDVSASDVSRGAGLHVSQLFPLAQAALRGCRAAGPGWGPGACAGGGRPQPITDAE